MQVHEITRSAYYQVLHGLDVLAFQSEEVQSQIKRADWVIVRMPVCFGHVCKYASLLCPYDCESHALGDAEILERHELSRLLHPILESTKKHPVLYAFEVWHIVEDSDWVILWGYQNDEKPWTNVDGEHLQALFPDDEKALRFAYVAVAQKHCDRVVIDGIHGYYCIELGEEGPGLVVQLEEKVRNKHDAYYSVKNASSFYVVSLVDTGNVKKKYVCPDCGYESAVV